MSFINLDIWKAYFLMYINPESSIIDYNKAFTHYYTKGKREGNILFDWIYYKYTIPQVDANKIKKMEHSLQHYLEFNSNNNGIYKTHGFIDQLEIANTILLLLFMGSLYLIIVNVSNTSFIFVKLNIHF